MASRGVIFDLDGVLVSTDEFHYLAWKRLAEDEGIPFSRRVNERQRGVSRMDSLEVLLEAAPRSYRAAEKREMADRKNGYYREFLQDLKPGDVLPGAREMLVRLREMGVRTAIASSSRNTPVILEKLDLGRLADAVVDGNEIRASKPDPEIFLLAAGKLGLRPAECAVVEDAPAGVEAARRAGMAAFAIDPRGILADVRARAASLADVSAQDLVDLKVEG